MPEKLQNRIDETTVKSFVDGDMRAFDIIYFVFNPKLQRFVYTLVKTEIDTEEIVQDVFVKVWENRENLKSFTSFESYLFSIAYHTTISLLRNRLRETRYLEFVRSVQIEVDDDGVPDDLNWEVIDQQLYHLIEEMPPRQMEVFKMKHYQGFSYKEISDKLGISVNTIENHIVKAHKFLKKNLRKGYFASLLFIHLFF
jgi:RNA polymerase sigma-70 factor, ECF subfamily